MSCKKTVSASLVSLVVFLVEFLFFSTSMTAVSIVLESPRLECTLELHRPLATFVCSRGTGQDEKELLVGILLGVLWTIIVSLSQRRSLLWKNRDALFRTLTPDLYYLFKSRVGNVF